MRFLAGVFPQRLAARAGLFFMSLSLVACATYQSKVATSRSLLERGKALEAADTLRPLAETEDGDQLVYLLDYATSLQAAGRFEESNRQFLKADQLAERMDYHSVTRVAGSLLLNEETKQYKGDTFEKIFINAQLAMNFLEMGNLESALVEARRMNEKYAKLRQEEKKDFELNPLGRYLSALAWEADGNYDSAAIAYTETYQIGGLEIEGLAQDLLRITKLARRENEYKKWKKTFPDITEDPAWFDRKKGELVILVQQGWGPRKTFSRTDVRWPELRPVRTETRRIRAQLNQKSVESQVLYNVESAAIRTLEDDRLSLLGRRLTGIVAKEVTAQEIHRRNELLGIFAWLFMHLSDRADLRQWSTLPESVQIIRLPLDPGSYDLELQGLDVSGSLTEERHERTGVVIKARQKTFVTWRTWK